MVSNGEHQWAGGWMVRLSLFWLLVAIVCGDGESWFCFDCWCCNYCCMTRLVLVVVGDGGGGGGCVCRHWEMGLLLFRFFSLDR